MPAFDVFIISAIVVVFVVFGAVLAWADYQTRDLPQTTRAAQPAPPARSSGPSSIDRKEAA